MAKDKKGTKTAAAPPKVDAGKNVKAGRVTKPTEQPKAAAKEIAKKAAKGAEKAAKKTKKAVEPESDSEDDTSDSSDSSADDVKAKINAKAKANGKVNGKVNGKAKAAASDSDSDSSDASDSEEEVAPKKAQLPKTNGKADSDDDDESSASDSDEDEVPKTNGKAAATSDSEEDSDDDSESDAAPGAKAVAAVDDEDDDDDDSSDDDDESDKEEAPVAKQAEEGGKKRKAEDTIAKTPKKTKVMVEGEMKEATANLFVGNLSWNVDEEWLTREFEKFGELNSVRIITDRDSGRSKGFGYVEFNESENAAAALETNQGLELDGRGIRIDFSTGRQQKPDGQTPQQRTFDRAQKYGDTPREPSATLFVGNVSFDADESMVTEMFQEYGSINSVRLPTDRETGQMKGFGYVEFNSIDEATAAFEGLQGGELAGRPVRLDYSTPRSTDSPRGGGGFRGGDRGGRGGRGGFGGRGGGRGGFGDRGGRGRGGSRGGRGMTTNRGGFGDFSGKKTQF